MTFEYSGDPSSTTKDTVRFLIGDTNDQDQQLQDEEIDWLLLQHPNVFLAAALGAENIASQYARQTTKSVGGLSVSYGERQTHYSQLAAALRAEAERTGATPTPISLGMSKGAKDSRTEDEDLNLTPLSIGMHDNPGTGASNG
jgi:hypothetical protein